MQKQQMPCAAANFMRGRPPGIAVEAIVLHRTGGTAEQFRTRYLDPSTSVSTHYVISEQGTVAQYVQENDTAFHAGVVINATWKGLRPRINPNFHTIGVELEGVSDTAVAEVQMQAAAELVAE